MLSVQQLSKRYGDKIVLDALSLEIVPGEIVGIIGESGSGKSTLARILCGTQRPDHGMVFFQNQLLLSADKPFDPLFRRCIQLIPQQPYASLDPLQTVGAAICEPLLFHKLVASKQEAHQRMQELLESVLLPVSLASRRPAALSGGQVQRVLIARSLAVQPALLIADEATSMLDMHAQAQIVRIFQQLSRRFGVAVLLISHDHALLASAAKRVYQLEKGLLEQKML